MTTLNLTRDAIDNHGNRYDVVLREETRRDGSTDFVLSIEGTPGKWYISSLRNVGDRLAIDFGQDWYCENASVLIAEATCLIQDARMSDEARAEMEFEMRAAFGPGQTVVNVFTGKKYTT